MVQNFRNTKCFTIIDGLLKINAIYYHIILSIIKQGVSMLQKLFYYLFVVSLLFTTVIAQSGIIHDGEYNYIEAQHSEKWVNEDITIDAKLEEIRKNNDGKRPNILYILVDDVGFGDFGIPELNYIRGTKTPNINKLADEGLSLMRMYTERQHVLL